MRTHYCADVNAQHIDQTVEFCGWVNRRRDHGGVIFIDLRDRTGLVQVVYDPDIEDVFATAEQVRNEFVLLLRRVRQRPEGTVNPDLATGEIEVLGKELKFSIARLALPNRRYRHCGRTALALSLHRLRRAEMQQRIMLRTQVSCALRRYLDGNAFDIETPILTRLRQRARLLVPGFMRVNSSLCRNRPSCSNNCRWWRADRYYQIVRCFRDEASALTASQNSPSWISKCPSLMKANHAVDGRHDPPAFSKTRVIELPIHLQKTYAEAMRRYGSDRPDLRCSLNESMWLI